MDGEWGTYDIAYEGKGKGGRAAGCIIVVEEETIRQGGIHSAHGMGGEIVPCTHWVFRSEAFRPNSSSILHHTHTHA